MTRLQLPRLLLLLALGLGLPFLRVAWGLQHQVVSFDRIAKLDYDRAMAEIIARQGGNTSAVFDNEQAFARETGMPPGKYFIYDRELTQLAQQAWSVPAKRAEVSRIEALQRSGQGREADLRFTNLGPGRAAIYAGERGTWFLLGRFQISEYKGGEWRDLGVFENQRLNSPRSP